MFLPVQMPEFNSKSPACPEKCPSSDQNARERCIITKYISLLRLRNQGSNLHSSSSNPRGAFIYPAPDPAVRVGAGLRLYHVNGSRRVLSTVLHFIITLF